VSGTAHGDTGGGGLRRDPLSGAWTVIVAGRGARPHDHPAGSAGGAEHAAGPTVGGGVASGVAPAPPATCPFCEGHEQMTPPELDALRPDGSAPDTPGWAVRVVPNKYPVFEGGHEVIVHSPSHDRPLFTQTLAEVTDVVTMYQRRIAALCAGGAAAVTVILNHGRAAGASLSHPHSQVFATPMVPPVLVSELEQFARYQVKYGRCLLCDVLGATIAEGSRVVFDGPFVAWTPKASRWPYELRLAPRAHEPDFLRTDPGAAAGALKRALKTVVAATADVALNAWLHTTPCRSAEDQAEPQFHWHIEIAPRLTTLAGFELGTGIGVDTLDPVEAAARLRAELPPADA
jgi:UDPglucose--hexose-1-phosphate uridylyltransferase